jgi:Ser/Thr protein kinase RdoA (MazF antagonist)
VWHRVSVPQPPPSIRHVRAWLTDWELPVPPRVRPLAGGFTSHVWRIDVGESVYVAKLAYQPRADVDSGLRAAAILARHGLRTGPALHTRAGELTRHVQYPAGHWHALAVLRFVDGEPLDWRTTEALRIAGTTLGTLHRVLLEDGSLALEDQLFGYLIDDNAWDRQPNLQPIITRAVAAVRSFEARCPVTYGPIYGDGLQVRVDTCDGTIGLIDWGTVSRGPLLFDVALAVHAAQRAGHVDLTELFAPYLARAPMRPAELDGLRYYEALMWARSAKYFGYRLQHQVLLGDSRPRANAESLASALAALERLVGE